MIDESVLQEYMELIKYNLVEKVYDSDISFCNDDEMRGAIKVLGTILEKDEEE